MVKCRIFLVVFIAIVIFASPCFAGGPNTFGMLLEYRNYDINYKNTHDTHKDDFFLPRANVAGSAGETSLGRASMVALGVSYEPWIVNDWSIGLSAGGLIGTSSDRKKNANDPRPDANAAFIYSEANYGFFGGVGLFYHIKSFYLGAEGQLAGIHVESGWDRFNAHQQVSSEFKFIPTVGPKLGFAIGDFRVEGTVQFGEKVNFAVGGRWMFF